MATGKFGRRDPSDPLIPGPSPGDPQMSPMGMWFDPNGGERPRRGRAPRPPTPSFPPKSFEEYCLLTQHAILCGLESRYVADILGRFIEETSRSFIRPVSTPPWVHPPFNSVPLGGSGTGNTGGLGVYTTLVEGYVPRGFWGVIRRLGQDTANVAAGTGISAWSSLQWDFAIAPGGTTQPSGTFVSVPAYTDFGQQRGQIEAPCETFLFVPEGHWFRFRVKESGAGGPFAVTGLAIGWRWFIRGGRLDGSSKGVMGD